MFRHRISRPLAFVAGTLSALLVAGTPLLGQSSNGLTQSSEVLTPGDVVRVDHDFIGTLMSITEGETLTVLGEGKPTCWPGIGHGDAPRCDPAPIVRRVVDWSDVTVERQLVELSYTGRMMVGVVLGAAALAPIGYVTGPLLGYGKIEACVEVSDSRLCNESVSREAFESQQRSQDQRRGAWAFALLGASVGAIVARKTANEWLEVSPPGLGSDDAAWSVSVRVPLANR